MKKRFFLMLIISAALLYASTLTAHCATVRDVVCAYIDHMASIKWTPAKAFASCNDISKVFRSGKTYQGMPYTKNNVQNLRVFRENLDKSPVPKYTGPTSADKYIGTDSAGAVLSAWSEIGAAVSFTDEKDMFPSLKNGVLAVGSYDFTWNSSSTAEIAGAEEEAVMFESYAMLHSGDALFKYIRNGPKGSFIAMDINVVKTSSGAIDGQKSNVYVIGQNIFESMASTTTWHYYKKYTFNNLLEEGYLPVTCAELKASDSTLSAPIIYVSEFEGGKRISITDKNENTSVYYTTDGTTPSKSSTKYNGEITVTTSVSINAIAVADTAKSAVASRNVDVPSCSVPKVTVADFIAGKMLTAECSDADAIIYYSVDGTAFEKYTAPFIADHSCTVNCYATKVGCKRSSTIQTQIKMATVSKPAVESIESTAGGKKITLTSKTPDAVFYYTVDDSEPYEDSKSFKDSIVIAKSCTLNVRALKSGMGISETVSVNVDLPKVQEPEVILTDITGGKKAALKCPTVGSRIYYTTDGTTPKTTGQMYDKPFYITDTCTLKAIAVKEGCETASLERKITIAQVSVPVIKVNSEMKTVLSCEIDGAVIYYTLDGKMPNMFSNKYTTSFKVEKGTVIRAFAVRSGMKLSDTVSVTANGAVTTESTMVLSDYNYPTLLSFGQGYEIKGRIKSNYKIISVTLGIYDDDGQMLSGGTANPDSKEVDIASLSGIIDFSKSVAGSNYYRITATDMQGTKKLFNKQFSVSSPNKNVSSLSLTDGSFPSSLKLNESFNLHGKITSNYNLRYVSVGIFDTNGRAISICKCSTASKSFYLGATDKKLDFSALKSGTYYLRVTAADSAVKKTLLNRVFTVLPAAEKSRILLKGQKLPDIIEQGSKFDIQGKITADNIIKYIGIELRGSNDEIIFERSFSANSTEYDISLLAGYLRFEYLTGGIYKLRIAAADANQRHILASKEFIITEDSDCRIADINRLYSYDYRNTVCTIDGTDYSVASCGSFAVCVAMVQNYLNNGTKRVSPDDVLSSAYDEGIFKGKVLTPRQILELCDKHYHMDVTVTGDRQDMKDSLKRGEPVIAHIAAGELCRRSEYVVVRGYADTGDGEYVYINSPSSPILSASAIKLSDFLKAADNGLFILYSAQ